MINLADALDGRPSVRLSSRRGGDLRYISSIDPWIARACAMQVLQRPARATRLASGLPLHGPMNVKIGAWGVSIAAAIGAAAAWFLEWPSATSAAVGAVLVPLVAVATGVVSSGRRISPGTQPPPRGVCECGHVMSMHCASDGSGPCAAADCPCAGSNRAASTQ